MGLAAQINKGIDVATYLASRGKVFYAADSTAIETVTGQTSVATTTPTFLLQVPSGTTAIPLGCNLFQTGSVAGGLITVIMELDNADRYASGGTAETIFPARTLGPSGATTAPTSSCVLYSGATATDAYGVRIDAAKFIAEVTPTIGETVSGQTGAYIWTPSGGYSFLVGPAAWLVYTAAGTTGPTWLWNVKWAEVETVNL